MDTITRKTPKDEILAAYNALAAEHAALRSGVVSTALKLGIQHGWCKVVRQGLQRMGLGAELPEIFVVETRFRGRNHFSEADWFLTEREARADFEKESAKSWSHDYDYRLRSVDGNNKKRTLELKRGRVR